MVAPFEDMFKKKTPEHDDLKHEDVKYLSPEELTVEKSKPTFR